MLKLKKTLKMPDLTEKRFEKAYAMASATNRSFPPDIMLNFYAYYKRATEKNGFYIPPSQKGNLKDAFKINALVQVKDISKIEAQKKYIELVEQHIGPL